MDAFEKLAKLAGASVESVGDGLPRTRAEAFAEKSDWYFTGDPCWAGHIAKRSALSRLCVECEKWQSNMTQSQIDIRREVMKEDIRKKSLSHGRKVALLKLGDGLLHSIGCAMWAASHGRVPADIPANCPEPQRGQLRALVDRIKADPQAGKAVVGLLWTMRELRKAELAELRAAA